MTSDSEHSGEGLNAQDVRQILGVNFYVGDLDATIERISHGGLLVVPAAPALKDISWNSSYREALIDSDVAITDSAWMVILWNLFERDSIRRVSGWDSGKSIQSPCRRPARYGSPSGLARQPAAETDCKRSSVASRALVARSSRPGDLRPVWFSMRRSYQCEVRRLET